jgi:hypothetical protein
MLCRTFRLRCAAVAVAPATNEKPSAVAAVARESGPSAPHALLQGFNDRAMISPPTLHVHLGAAKHRHITVTYDMDPDRAPLRSSAYLLVDDAVDLAKTPDTPGKGGHVWLSNRGPKEAVAVISSSCDHLFTGPGGSAATPMPPSSGLSMAPRNNRSLRRE